MDVTPTTPMYRVLAIMADKFIGEAPLKIETSPAAMKRREAREEFMATMHQFIAMTMREGARRAFEERGLPTVEAPMKSAHH